MCSVAAQRVAACVRTWRAEGGAGCGPSKTPISLSAKGTRGIGRDPFERTAGMPSRDGGIKLHGGPNQARVGGEGSSLSLR
jgi:hypothetical protein